MRKRQRPTATTSFELGDLEYEVGAYDFSPPTHATRDDPGDGGEVTPGNLVRVIGSDPEVWHVVPYAVFLLYFASELTRQTDTAPKPRGSETQADAWLEQADRLVCDALLTACCDEMYDPEPEDY